MQSTRYGDVYAIKFVLSVEHWQRVFYFSEIDFFIEFDSFVRNRVSVDGKMKLEQVDNMHNSRTTEIRLRTLT